MGRASRATYPIYINADIISKLADGIHVLHAFQKKTSQTGKQDVEAIWARLAPLLERERQRKKP